MSITPKEKELVAIGISVAAGCKPCTDHHVNVARKARATDEAIRQAMDDALSVRRTAADIMKAHALAHLGEDLEVIGFGIPGGPSRIKALVAVGAAFAVNCVSSVEHHLAAADVSGVSQDDIVEIVKLAVFIKKMAASHVERLVGMSEEEAA
jgi:AhpD family alkylhydroperoxidase